MGTTMESNWKVKLFLAHAKAAAEHVDTFGVKAADPDKARTAARAWLEERGHRVRTVSITTTPGELVAYVFPKAKEIKA